MIRLCTIDAENFLSYPRLHLEFQAGVWLLLGENGAGKSAVSEALSWCLFGQTVRGVVGDAVVHDPARTGAGRNCAVAVEFFDGQGVRHRVSRYRKHKAERNSVRVFRLAGVPEELTLGSERATTERIGQLLGLDWETFKITSLFGQGQLDRFTVATDSQRKAILDEMLGTQVFSDALEVVRDRTRATLANHAQAIRDVEIAAGMLQVQQEQVAAETHAAAVWSVQQEQRFSAIEARYQEAEGKLAGLRLPDLAAVRATHEAAQAAYQAEQARCERALTQAEDGHVAATQAVNEISAKFPDEQAVEASRAELRRQVQVAEASAVELRRLVETLVESERMSWLSRTQAAARVVTSAREEHLRALGAARDAAASVHTDVCAACGTDLIAAAAAGLCPARDLAARELHVAQLVKAAERAAHVFDQALADEAVVQRQAAGAAEPARVTESRTRAAEQDARAAALREQAAALSCESRVPAELLDEAKRVLDVQARSAAALACARDALRQLSKCPQAVALQAAASAVLAADHAAAQYRRDQTWWQERKAAAAQEAEQLAVLENPHELRLVELRAAADVSQEKIAARTRDAAQAGALLADLHVLDRAFGAQGIRSLLLDQVTPALNAAAHRYATALAGGRITVTFSATSELKSGETRDRFDVSVQVHPGAGEYREASGGWQRRADLVALLALRKVAQERRSGLDLLVLDEPLVHVDAEGVESAATLISEVARDLGTVLLCSHDPAFQAYFPQRLTVRRDQAGRSTLEA